MKAVARSLAECYSLRASATSVVLRSHPDLTCMNIMCEKLGQGCACRLALSLSRMALVESVDISNNKLPVLPDSVWNLPKLRSLDASGE